MFLQDNAHFGTLFLRAHGDASGVQNHYLFIYMLYMLHATYQRKNTFYLP